MAIKTNIASQEQILKDYNKFNPILDFNEFDITSSIIALSLLGHAKNGHNTYKGETYPQTTINDILFATQSEYLREKSSDYIKNTFSLFKEIMNITIGKENIEDSYFYNYKLRGIELSEGSSIFDSRLFQGQIIKNPDFFLKGVYVASQMDSLERRIETKEKYKLSLNDSKYILGGGVCHVADLKNIKRLNIDIKELEDNEQGQNKFNYLVNQGCILLKDELEFSTNKDHNLINLYIRGKNGLGICDDAAMLSSSMLIKKEFGFQKAKDYYLGMAIMDTIDTEDKISLDLVTGGADEYIGNQLNEIYKNNYGVDLATKNEIYRTIYLGAKSNTFKLPFSSSVRYFNQEKPESSNLIKTTHRSHLNFLENEEVIENLFFGYQRMKSEDFYNVIKNRVELYEEKIKKNSMNNNNNNNNK